MERPLDFLNSSKGKDVLVQLKGNKQVSGRLLAFDININVVLENVNELENSEVLKHIGIVFIRGDNIVWVSPNAKSN
jgi:small nuclear ribonucleoprotein